MRLLNPGIEAFLAVIHQGTVHGAAREIGLSQTGVTQRIRVLERELGVTLFVRSRRGMCPTAEGEALVRWCQSVGELEGELLSFVRRGDEAATVRVTVTGPSSLMRSRVIPEVTGALRRFPGVTVRLLLDDTGSGLNHLKTGAAQLAVLPGDDVVNELDAKPLRPVRYRLVGPADWAGRDAAEVVAEERVVDFDEADDATFAFLREHGLLSAERRRRHLVNNPDALADLVSRGFGYTVLDEDFARPLLADGTLVDLCPGKCREVDIALAWYPRHEMSAYFQALLDAVR
ncbi:LysR family transcriptional regulator [bacterium]|nr:LysR family transcriptional regulator [bacterium]